MASLSPVQTDLESALFTGEVKAFNTQDGYAQGSGRVVPADETTGWCKGAVFVHTDGSGAADCLYVNIGDTLGCQFVAVNAILESDLASTAGAGKVGLADSGEFTDNTTVETALAEMFQHLLSTSRPHEIPLFGWREATTFDVGAIAANGGILASDTTPILEAINAGSDGCQRIHWASSNSDQIIAQVTLPAEFDAAQDLKIMVRAAMSGGTDMPNLTVESFFNEADTKVSDSLSASISGTGWAEYICTIDADDIPDGARTLTIGITPGSHTTDALYVSATWIEYKTSLRTS